MAERNPNLNIGELRAVLPIGWEKDIDKARVVHFLGVGVLSRFDSTIFDGHDVPVIKIEDTEIPGVSCWHLSHEDWLSIQEEHISNGIAIMPTDPKAYMKEVYPSFNKKQRWLRLPKFFRKK
jgi:hypothetical protein